MRSSNSFRTASRTGYEFTLQSPSRRFCVVKDRDRTPAATRPPRVGARAAANDDADAASEHKEPDPLWVIVIGMAVFFGITAVLLIAD